MSINTEFYSGAHNFNYGREVADVKIADWAFTDTNTGSIGALTMSKNEIGIELDPSIIPWKIHVNSDVMRRYYTYFQKDKTGVPINKYTGVHHGIKDGYRFILGTQNKWTSIAGGAPSNYNNSRPIWNSRHEHWTDLTAYQSTALPYEKELFPFIDFDYHNTIASPYIAYISKSSFIADEAPYGYNTASLSQITDTFLTNNYIVGVVITLYTGGTNTETGSYETDALRCQLIPFDRVKPSLYADSEFDAYGSDTLQYWNSILNFNDNRDGGLAIGGYYPRQSIMRNATPTAADWYNDGNAGKYSAYDMPATLGGAIEYSENDPDTYDMYKWTFLGNASSWSWASAIPKDLNSMTVTELIEYVHTQLAYLGFLFTDSRGYARYGFLPSHAADYYVPEIDSDGVTTGNYEPYPIADFINKEWTTNIPDVTPYDPTTDIPDPDPNEYDDNTTVLNDVGIIPKFTTRYILTTGEISHAHEFLLSQIAANVDSDFWSSQKLYVNNPIDVVQNVLLFPFDISDYQTDEPSYRDLTFGQLSDTGYSVQLNREQYCIINMGGCTYYPKLGNNPKDFRNYPPYSSAVLYIPYCGSVEIDPNLYMGHSISVKLIVDMATGSCLALIYRDNMVVDSISGTIGISFPITGIQSQTLAAAERQAEQQLKMARVNGAFGVANAITGVSGGAASGAAAGLMTGGLAGAVAGGIIGGTSKLVGGAQNVYNDIQNIKNAQYNLEHIQVPYKTIGTATASTSWANERKCRLIIRRPLMMTYNPETYAHNSGYACLITATVGEFTGYTEFQTVDLTGISATSQEKTQLYKLLQGGVFL